MSRKRFLYVCAVLAILLSSAVTPFFLSAIAVAASPDTPSNVSPADAATDVSLKPMLQSSAFSDPNAGDYHAASQWQIRTSSGNYYSPVFDSGRDRSNLTSIVVPSGMLDYSTTYCWHVRHRANQRDWSGWSSETSFATTNEITAPVISGVTVTNIIGTGATITWTTNEPASSQVEYGPTASYGSSTTLDSILLTSHSVDLTGLSPGTAYHCRMISVDAWGNPAQSGDYTFTTQTVPLSVATSDATGIGNTTATLNGNLTGLGTASSVTVSFVWGTTLGGPHPNETTAVAKFVFGIFYSDLAGLSPGTTYYYLAKVVGDGTSYGVEMSFTTSTPPSVTTNAAIQVTAGSARLNGDLTSMGTATSIVVSFEWGTNPASYPNEAASQYLAYTGAFSVDLTGLTPGTTYRFRAKAVGDGTSYGVEKSFATGTIDTVPPSTPSRVSPVYGTHVSSTPSFDWSDVSDSSGVTYQLQIDNNSDYSSPLLTKVGLISSGCTLTAGEALAPGVYYWRARAVDGAGNASAWNRGDWQIMVEGVSDTTPPTTPVVSDDSTTTTSTSQIHAIWTSSDAESGIAEYQYAVGTTSGGTNVIGWTSVGTNTQVTRTGLSLTAGTKYFISVKAKNGSGLWSETEMSNGITVAAEGMAVENIPSAGGTVQTADGKITAEFPANAAVGELSVTIGYIASPSDTSTPQGFEPGNTYFVIEITDARGNPVLTLSQPITITLKCSQEDVDAAGRDPNDLVLAYYDEAAGEWKALKTSVDTAHMTLSASTTHLSTWAVLVNTPSASTGLPSWIWTVIVIVAVLVVAVGGGLVVVRQSEEKQ